MLISRRQLAAILATLPSLLAGARLSMAGEVRLALQGYDPVAYFTVAKPTLGKAEFAFEYDETRYLFASAENRALFIASPEKYAPMYNGYCAMGMAQGYKIEPNPQNWTIVDGHLYVASMPILPGILAADGENARRGADQWSRIHPAR